MYIIQNVHPNVLAVMYPRKNTTFTFVYILGTQVPESDYSRLLSPGIDKMAKIGDRVGIG